MTTTNVRIAAANAAQLQAWDGAEGEYWAEHADRFDRSIASYHDALMSAADLQPASRILDVGCGTGQTTRDAARIATGGRAHGVDLSSAMLAVARARATDEGCANATFEQADAQVHPFGPGEFDVAISRTGTMFFADHVAAFMNIALALRAGGRLVMLTWRPLDENEWLAEIAGALNPDGPLPPPNAGPFSLSQPTRVEELLTRSGFDDVAVTAVTERMWFGSDADHAASFVAGLMGWMLAGHDDRTRRHALDRLHATMAAHGTHNGVEFGSAAWLISAAR